MRSDEPVATALIVAIRGGDLDGLRALLDADPSLAGVPMEGRRGSRTPLAVATDWPGYWPNGPEIVRMLLAAGADPDDYAGETPLHWAASSDDVEVAEVLIDGGANLEAPGGSIAGSPLSNAVGYGCWHVARLLVARGARVEHAWQAAALGLQAQLEALLTPDQLNHAFWQACHGGQRRTAMWLLDQGADVRWTPDYAQESAAEIAGATDTRRSTMVEWLEGLHPAG